MTYVPGMGLPDIDLGSIEDLRDRRVPKRDDGIAPELEKRFSNSEVQKDVGQKDNKGKLQWRLLPLDAIEEILRVLMFGAYETPRSDGSKGYGPNNWEFVPDWSEVYYDAVMRHMAAYRKGERRDPVSKLHTLAHAGCGMLFLLAKELRGGTPRE